MKFKTVYTEITNRCNLNCATCYNRSGLNRLTQEMSLEQIKHIMKLGSDYGATRFLFSGGEPSLHSNFHGLLELIDRYPQFSFGFVTNGTVHDGEWIDFLNSHDNITVQVSLDGADEKSNQLTRGENNFARAVEFVKKLHLPTGKPLLKMVISQGNFYCAEDFYHLALSLGCVPELAFIYKSGNGSDNWDSKALSPQQKLSILRMVKSLNEKHGVEAYLPKCTVRCPYSVDAENMSVCIKVNGDIQPCQTLYSDDFSIGNIFDFNAKEVEKRVEALVSLAKQRLYCDYGCERCMLRSACGKGCMAEAVNNFGDPLASDGNCTFRKLQFLDTYVKSHNK
ncbi:MAG: radical SAM protein [Ruminococcaceae bacterium]|nr:radical SAM protein [Oscillospiraceae bacterium]